MKGDFYFESSRRSPEGNQSHPVGLGQPPEASLAWYWATQAAKRRQRALKLCD